MLSFIQKIFHRRKFQWLGFVLLFLRLVEAEEKEAKTKQKLSDTNRKLDQALAGLQELGQENQNIQVSTMELIVIEMLFRALRSQ